MFRKFTWKDAAFLLVLIVAFGAAVDELVRFIARHVHISVTISRTTEPK